MRLALCHFIGLLQYGRTQSFFKMLDWQLCFIGDVFSPGKDYGTALLHPGESSGCFVSLVQCHGTLSKTQTASH